MEFKNEARAPSFENEHDVGQWPARPSCRGLAAWLAPTTPLGSVAGYGCHTRARWKCRVLPDD